MCLCMRIRMCVNIYVYARTHARTCAPARERAPASSSVTKTMMHTPAHAPHSSESSTTSPTHPRTLRTYPPTHFTHLPTHALTHSPTNTGLAITSGVAWGSALPSSCAAAGCIHAAGGLLATHVVTYRPSCAVAKDSMHRVCMLSPVFVRVCVWCRQILHALQAHTC